MAAPAPQLHLNLASLSGSAESSPRSKTLQRVIFEDKIDPIEVETKLTAAIAASPRRRSSVTLPSPLATAAATGGAGDAVGDERSGQDRA